MGLISKPNTFTSGTTALSSEVNANFDTIYNEVNGSLSNANISGSAAIADTKLAQITTGGKVNATALTVTSQAQGDILYYNGTNWVRLAAGTSGQQLETKGAGANPEWGGVTQATQSAIEAETNENTYIPPDLMKHSPGMSKAWVSFNGTGTPAVITSYNVESSITDNGTGDYTLSWTTDFSGADYCVVGSGKENGSQVGPAVFIKTGSTQAAGTLNILTVAAHTAALTDFSVINLVAFGDQ